jgi:hypothetical protein
MPLNLVGLPTFFCHRFLFSFFCCCLVPSFGFMFLRPAGVVGFGFGADWFMVCVVTSCSIGIESSAFGSIRR